SQLPRSGGPARCTAALGPQPSPAQAGAATLQVACHLARVALPPPPGSPIVDRTALAGAQARASPAGVRGWLRSRSGARQHNRAARSAPARHAEEAALCYPTAAVHTPSAWLLLPMKQP